MPNFCLSEFMKASKNVLSKSDAREMLDELRKRAKEKSLQQNLTKADALGQTLDEFIETKKTQNQITKRNAYLALKAKKNIEDYIGKFADPLLGLRAKLDGIVQNIPNARFSTGALQKGEIESLFGGLLDKLGKTNSLDAFADRNLEADLANAMFDPDAKVSKPVRDAASAIKETYKESVKLLNNAGTNIGELDEYIARQTHSAEKMMNGDMSVWQRRMSRSKLRLSGLSKQAVYKKMGDIAFESWKNFILPRLDTQRTFENILATPDKYLRSVFDSVTTGVFLKPEKGEINLEFNFKKSFNLASKLGRERKIHFKDGKSWYEYNKKYGSGSVQQSVVNTLESSGRNLALLEDWGPNPEAMFNHISKMVREKATRELNIPPSRVNGKLKFSKSMFKELIGTTRIPVDELFAKTSSAFRNLGSMAKLGHIAISSINDFAMRATVARDHGVGFLDAYGELFNGHLSGLTKDEKKQFGAITGVWARSSFGHMVSRFHTLDTPAGVMSRLSQFFFKLSGIEWMDKFNRTGLGTSLSKRLSMLKDTKLANVPEGTRNILSLYGIEDKEWDLIRSPENLRKPFKNEIFITPDDADYYSADSIKEYLGKDKVSQKEVDETRRDIKKRLRTYFIDQTDMGHMQPGVTERTMITHGTQPGTMEGELLRFVGQFLTFNLGYMRRMMGRYLFRNGSIKNMTRKDVMGLVELMATSTAFGYVAMQAKNVVKGLQPRQFNGDIKNDFKIMVASLAQGGGISLAGDFLFGQYDRFGHSFSTTLLGPSAGTIDDVAKLLLTLEHLDNPSKTALELIENNTPFLNLWFARTALNYLFLYGIQEKISPGSMRRMKQNAEKNNDDKFIWDPSTTANRL